MQALISEAFIRPACTSKRGLLVFKEVILEGCFVPEVVEEERSGMLAE